MATNSNSIYELLAPDFYRAAETVAQEPIGAINAVTVNPGDDARVGKNKSVNSFFTEAPTVSESIVPGANMPDLVATELEERTLTLEYEAKTSFHWTQEHARIANMKGGYTQNAVHNNILEQHIRELVNHVEQFVMMELVAGSNSTLGAAGTDIFGSSDYGETAAVNRVLDDAGAPQSNRCMIIGNTEVERIRKEGNYMRYDAVGDASGLRTGQLTQLHGLDLFQSHQVNEASTIPGGTVKTDGAIAKGASSATLDGFTGGTPTVTRRSMFTAGGKPFVVSGLTATGTSNEVTVDIFETPNGVANDLTIVRLANVPAIGLYKNAAELAIRAPARDVADAARENFVVTDPRGMIGLEVAVYPGYRALQVELACVFGIKVWQPEYVVAYLR